MDVSKMKNIVVLKNLPSNIVDEAFVVLKSNKRVKKTEKVEKFSKVSDKKDEKKDKEYVLKEAELLVSDYISKIEDNKNLKSTKSSKKIKRWAYISTLIAVIEGVALFSC